MKLTLLSPGDHDAPPIGYGDTVFDDLGLHRVIDIAGGGDDFVTGAMRSTILHAVADPTVIAHRHAVLTDCCTHPDLTREVYAIATTASTVRRWPSRAGRRAGGTLVLAAAPFAAQLELLRRLRTLLHHHASGLSATGWTELVATTARFDDAYLDAVCTQLTTLQLEHGIEFDASLGIGNTMTDIVLREPPRTRRVRRGFPRTADVFEAIVDGDSNNDPVTALKDRALQALADVVSGAADELHHFFTRLREQIAFYLGCLTLRDHLDRAAVPYCLPHPHPPGAPLLRCRGLRDITLTLTTPPAGSATTPVTGNDLDADGRTLLVITGANNGGKSTFLRSLGAAQVMMQSGLFVLADRFAADLRDSVFTHFVDDEDRTLSHGKLVAELVRMNTVVDRIGRHGLLLCNEAFASTAARDATAITEPLLRAFTEAGTKVVTVTHLYDYAHARHARAYPGDLFLHAERTPEGHRTHRIVAGAPSPGGHADDLFAHVFGQPPGEFTPRGADCSAP